MLQPIGNKIAIKPDADLEKIGNVLLPSTAGEIKKRYRGTVIAVGRGELMSEKLSDGRIVFKDARKPMPVKVGDVVHWNDRGGFLTDTVDWEGQKIVMLMPDDLMAVEVKAND